MDCRECLENNTCAVYSTVVVAVIAKEERIIKTFSGRDLLIPSLAHHLILVLILILIIWMLNNFKYLVGVFSFPGMADGGVRAGDRNEKICPGPLPQIQMGSLHHLCKFLIMVQSAAKQKGE